MISTLKLLLLLFLLLIGGIILLVCLVLKVYTNEVMQFQNMYKSIIDINNQLNKYIERKRKTKVNKIQSIKSGNFFISFSSLEESYVELEKLIDIALECYENIDEVIVVRFNLSYLSDELIEIKRYIRVELWKNKGG